MGRERQAWSYGACISYALVLLASLLAFDFEPSGGSERLVPSSVCVLDLIGDIDDCGPADDLHPVDVPPVFVHPARHLIRLDIARSDGPFVATRRAYHFDARGPPLAG
jgi:hypothetical protein